MCHAPIGEQIGACPLPENWKGGGACLGWRVPMDRDAGVPYGWDSRLLLGFYLGGPWVSTLTNLRHHLRMNLWVSHLIGSGDVIPPIRFRSDCMKQYDWPG